MVPTKRSVLYLKNAGFQKSVCRPLWLSCRESPNCSPAFISLPHWNKGFINLNHNELQRLKFWCCFQSPNQVVLPTADFFLEEGKRGMSLKQNGCEGDFRYRFPDIFSWKIVQVRAQIKDNFLENWKYKFNYRNCCNRIKRSVDNLIKYLKRRTSFIFLTLDTLISVCIFSTLFFIHFLRYWQGEFVCQSKNSFPGDHFLYSHDFNVWFRADIVGRN